MMHQLALCPGPCDRRDHVDSAESVDRVDRVDGGAGSMARMLVEACVRLRERRELAGLVVAGCRCARRVVGAWPQ